MRLIALFATLLAGSATAAALGGRVVEDHSGAPVTSADVRVFKVGTREAVADLETDGEGNFQGPELMAGEYRLDVSKRNYVGASVRFPAGNGSLTVRLIRSGVITGQVADQEGHPVKGAFVFAMPSGSTAPSIDARVDERGRYRLHGLQPGRYALAVAYGATSMALGSAGSAATRPDTGSGVLFYPNNTQPQWFIISRGEEIQNIDFSLAPGTLSSVSGKVERGSAAGRFWLALTPVGQPALAAAVTQTQPDGSFHFEGIPIGSYHLFAAGPEIARGGRGALLGPEPLFARTSVQVGGQPIEGIALTVEGGRPVTFVLRTVHAESNACPPSAGIRLTSLEDWAVMFEYSASIGAKGARIDHVAPGKYRIDITDTGDQCYGAANQMLDLTGEIESKPVEVLVTPAGAIRGVLKGSAQPTGHAVVLMRSERDNGDAIQTVYPDAEGRFGFTGLRPGQYGIAARAAADLKTPWVADVARMVEITVPGGVPTQVELAAPPKEKP